MSLGNHGVSFAEFFQTKQNAKCVFCGRKPQETRDGREFFATCKKCHEQEISALVAFSEGRLTFGQLAQVPVTAATLLSGRMIQKFAAQMPIWGGKVSQERLAEWLDSPAVHAPWRSPRNGVYVQFLRKLELEAAAVKAKAAAAPAPDPVPAIEPAPAAPAAVEVEGGDAPKTEVVPPGTAVAEASVVAQAAPDINALSEQELEALTAPEPVAAPAEPPAAPAAEPAEVKKARAKRAKKS